MTVFAYTFVLINCFWVKKEKFLVSKTDRRKA